MSETLLEPNIDRLQLEDIEALNAEFALLSPRERIRLSRQLFGSQQVLATTFGPTAPILLQQAVEVTPDIAVVNVRHGHETAKTLEHARFYTQKFNLQLHIYEPSAGAEARKPDIDASDFQWRAKIEPFQRALDEHDARAYISGAMAWQTNERPAGRSSSSAAMCWRFIHYWTSRLMTLMHSSRRQVCRAIPTTTTRRRVMIKNKSAVSTRWPMWATVRLLTH